MTRLSVNINKIATLRNSRGGNVPNVLKAAIDCEKYGAEGITVHPRPDERHIKYQDVRDIKPHIHTELNVEGYPSENFINLVKEVQAHQVTLVPDGPDAITSNQGWDTITYFDLLTDVVNDFRSAGIRVSIFVDPDNKMVESAAKTGADRIELYTEPYAGQYIADREAAIKPYLKAAAVAQKVGLEINAGHDLSLTNLGYMKEKIPFMSEVSIGHALIADALYFGLENTIQMYKRLLK